MFLSLLDIIVLGDSNFYKHTYLVTYRNIETNEIDCKPIAVDHNINATKYEILYLIYTNIGYHDVIRYNLIHILK